MRAEIFWVDGLPVGRLALLPRPRGGGWLEDELASLRRCGVDRLVSLLTPAEVAKLGLEREPGLCAAHGLVFESFPFEDRTAPPAGRRTEEFLEHLHEQVQAGEAVAIHCRMGLGRSAVVVAALLVLAGRQPAEALARIGQARGLQVPDTDEQTTWLLDFARERSLAAGPAESKPDLFMKP